MQSGPLHRPDRGGFTILELAVVLVIIAILAAMLIPVYSGYQKRLDETKCLTNLKTLYVAASGYLQANDSWPQIPAALKDTDPVQFARNWVAALSPYGGVHAAWICPGMQRELGESMDSIENDDKYRIDYLGTSFDDNPTSPRRWQRYPWFIEAGDFHGRGNLLIFSDGSTAAVKDIVP